jgi:Peptidase A4 family
MNIRHTILLPAAAALAAATLVTACGASGTTSSASPTPAATKATKSPQAASAHTVDVTQREDSNWAGYAVTSSTADEVSFSSVSGDWTQPAVNCGAGSPSDSAFWVGLGGYTGEHLEQIGTSADCSATGQAVYSAWYELVPAGEVAVNLAVAPGDQFSAHVAVSGQTVNVSISNLTQHTTVSKQLQMSSPTVSSAEWIAEAPSKCDSSSDQDCRILPLADFGTVTFTDASVSAGGRSGSITSGLGSVEALTLEANPGFGRMYLASAQADASPEALSSSGASFAVSWVQPELQVPDPSAVPSGPFFHAARAGS